MKTPKKERETWSMSEVIVSSKIFEKPPVYVENFEDLGKKAIFEVI